MSDPVDVCVVAMLPLFSHDDCGWSTPFQLRSGSCWSVSPVVAHVTWLKDNRLAHVLAQQGTSQAEVGVSLNHGLVGLLSQAQLLHEFSDGSKWAGLLREDSSDSKPGTCGV